MNDAGEIGDGRLGLQMSEERADEILRNLVDGRLFEDPDFPADSSSLFYSKRSPEELSQV